MMQRDVATERASGCVQSDSQVIPDLQVSLSVSYILFTQWSKRKANMKQT